MKAESVEHALDTLADLGLSRAEAVARFARITRRWSRINATFALMMGSYVRGVREQANAEAIGLHRWADDGGRA